jgi:N-acetylglucosamine-6-phosphate deacetylase
VLFTTDCASPAGAPPGRYRSLGVELEVGADRVVRVPGQPNFAGSALTLEQGAVNVSTWLNLSLRDAWALCSTAPAGFFGIDLPQIPLPEDLPGPSSPPNLAGRE